MKQVLIHKGQVIVEDIPAPMVRPGTVLVAVRFSCISPGTELGSIKDDAKPLWRKVLEKPESVKKAINMAFTEGIVKASDRVQSAMASEKPIGYSLAGIVLEVGEGISDLKPGDPVACAGAQCAYHAEIVCVPRSLVVPIPENVDFSDASTVTLGAIALQGVRRLDPTLGESFVVIGLGILGQLTIQMLKANGCRVIGTDLDPDRIALARSKGMDAELDPQGGSGIEQVHRLTDGTGADGVIVTAASSSSEPLSTAFKMCRKKGRVVLVGAVGMEINREDIYSKELDLFISTSYGPGRYDEQYEERGIDYPIAYVRWTENRNMAEYLRLVAEGRINVKNLGFASYPIADAALAYADLEKAVSRPLFSLLSYPLRQAEIVRRVKIEEPHKTSLSGKIRIAVVGAGEFAKGNHLPHLKKLSDLYEIGAICDIIGHNAKSTAKQFEAGYAATDYDQILADPAIDAVIIATRHHLHAKMALQALKSGKHVLVEKPLSITSEDVVSIQSFFSENPAGPVLLTGFNRRFSPHIRRIEHIVKKRTNPMIINYRMNAGYIPLTHWVHGPEGGGRNIGEACHIYDLFTFLTNARVKQVAAQSIHPKTGFYGSRDNFVGMFLFEDGSIATLTYTSLGSKEYPKEKMDIYVDGQVLVMEDYKTVNVFGSNEKGIKTKIMDKGLLEELRQFAGPISGITPWPNPLWQQVQAMEMAFEIEKMLNG